MKYRKKPITVEAHQWFKNGDHPNDYATPDRFNTALALLSMTTEGRVVRYFRHPDVSGQLKCSTCGLRMNVHGWIDSVNTLNPSGCTVCPGDYILPELSDATKYYPCKPDIFEKTYEPA